jgi:hypothetical protein
MANPNNFRRIQCSIIIVFEPCHHLVLELQKSLIKTTDCTKKFSHEAECARKSYRWLHEEGSIIWNSMKKSLNKSV